MVLGYLCTLHFSLVVHSLYYVIRTELIVILSRSDDKTNDTTE